MSSVLVAYVPVLHKGYLDFFKERDLSTIFLVGEEVLELLPGMDYVRRKDALRALDATEVQKQLQALGFSGVEVLSQGSLKTLNTKEVSVVMPDEDISHELCEQFLEHPTVEFVPVFLRWHRDNTKENSEVSADKTVSTTEFDRSIMRTLEQEADKSFDWWRQVAAAVIKDGEIILMGHNTHLPDEQSPNVFGDPRAVSKKGVDFHITTAAHAELAVVGEAAKRGISLSGTSLYVTDFPCPFCARIIVHAGFAQCFFRKGYANLDGEKLLKEYNVELIHVAED